MNIAIFNKNTINEYKELLSDCNLDLDIYYQPEFLDLEAELIQAEYEIFTITNQTNQHVFIYPYLKVPHKEAFEGWFDLTSPYGYAGPYCNEFEFFNTSEALFLEYAKKQNIVSEFVRYHFIYNEQLLFSRNIKNEHNRTVVVYDLSFAWDNILLNNISKRNRTYFNKFNKDEFVFEITDSLAALEEFIPMYYETMKNVEAVDSFFFKEEYFAKLFDTLKGKVKIGRIFKDNNTYASILFLISGGYVQLYLNGRNLQHNKLPSNVPLIINIAKWAKENNFQFVNLGGGRSNDPLDSLFLYKKHVSNQIRNFFVGKRIHDCEKYQFLVDKFIQEQGLENYQKVQMRLQFYR